MTPEQAQKILAGETVITDDYARHEIKLNAEVAMIALQQIARMEWEYGATYLGVRSRRIKVDWVERRPGQPHEDYMQRVQRQLEENKLLESQGNHRHRIVRRIVSTPQPI